MAYNPTHIDAKGLRQPGVAPRGPSQGPNQFSNLFMQDRATRAGDKTKAVSALERATANFGPNYGKGMEMEAKAAASARNITSGLGGVSVEGSVSAGLTAKFEDMRLRGASEMEVAMAGLLSNWRDPGTVTPSHMLGAEQLAQSRPQQRIAAPNYSNVTNLGVGQGYGVGGQTYMSSVGAKWASKKARNPFM